MNKKNIITINSQEILINYLQTFSLVSTKYVIKFHLFLRLFSTKYIIKFHLFMLEFFIFWELLYFENLYIYLQTTTFLKI